MFKHILFPTDGSDLSKNAARCVVSFAKKTGAQITVFYALEDKFGTLTEELEEQICDALDSVEECCKEVEVSCKKLTLTSDSPYEGILKASEQSDCDLIFMASHGHKGFKKLLLGSVTQDVLTHSKTPVLVYRSPQ